MDAEVPGGRDEPALRLRRPVPPDLVRHGLLGVLPSDLAIVASLSPLLSPASICSLSSWVIGLLSAAMPAPVLRPLWALAPISRELR